MKFGSGILGAEAPVDGGLYRVASGRIGGDGCGQGCLVPMASLQISSRQHAEFDFRHYAVPKALEQYRSAELSGQATYRDHTVRVPPEAVDEQFVQNLGKLIQRLAADEPARRMPSPQECRFCDISAADCPERMDTASEDGTAATDDF